MNDCFKGHTRQVSTYYNLQSAILETKNANFIAAGTVYVRYYFKIHYKF